MSNAPLQVSTMHIWAIILAYLMMYTRQASTLQTVAMTPTLHSMILSRGLQLLRIATTAIVFSVFSSILLARTPYLFYEGDNH